MEAAVLFIMVLGLLFLGVPIAISLGLSSVIAIAFFSHDSISSVALQLFTASQNYTLLAIPFFILASAFMSTGGVARRIIRFAIACVGHVRGGLAIAAVFSCMLFAALSGSSPASAGPEQKRLPATTNGTMRVRLNFILGLRVIASFRSIRRAPRRRDGRSRGPGRRASCGNSR